MSTAISLSLKTEENRKKSNRWVRLAKARAVLLDKRSLSAELSPQAKQHSRKPEKATAIEKRQKTIIYHVFA